MLGPGVQVGRYVLGERIGSGELAEVYRGRDDRLARQVAVKVLHGSRRRDIREAQAVAALDHPNIVPLLDVFEHDGRLCLVQPWMEGGSLQSELDRRGRLTSPETVRVGQDIAAALAHAHAHGVLHRDLKPSNVLRDHAGAYHLADFGAVGQLDPVTGTTRAGQIAGTPIWMSPEQITGGPQGPASDIFGLGLLLFQCQYGYLPAEVSDGVLDVLRQRVTIQIHVPESPLQSLIAQCLQLDAAQRPESATEVLKELRFLAEVSQLPGHAEQPNPVGSAPIPHAWELGSGAAAPAKSRLPTRRRSLLVSAALILTAVVLSGILASVGIFDWSSVAFVGVGGMVAALSIMLAAWLRVRWLPPSPEAEREATRVLFGAESRGDLTASLVIEVDQLIARLRSLDDKILGITVVAMVREYEDGKISSDRQAALLNIVTLMEKLRTKLSPWHIRHRETLTLGIAATGCLTGLIGALSPFLS